MRAVWLTAALFYGIVSRSTALVFQPDGKPARWLHSSTAARHSRAFARHAAAGAADVSNTDAEVVAHTRRWVQAFIIERNLCPYAKAPDDSGQIEYTTTSATDAEGFVDAFLSAGEALVETEATGSTAAATVLIAPRLAISLDDFSALSSSIEEGLEGVGGDDDDDYGDPDAAGEGDDLLVTDFTNSERAWSVDESTGKVSSVGRGEERSADAADAFDSDDDDDGEDDDDDDDAQLFGGAIGVAWFHPEWTFDGAPADDAVHFERRAPFPLVTLLRTKDVGAIVRAGLERGVFVSREIQLHNAKRLRSEGVPALREALDRLRSSSPPSPRP